jgi:hypothetical protein
VHDRTAKRIAFVEVNRLARARFSPRDLAAHDHKCARGLRFDGSIFRKLARFFEAMGGLAKITRLTRAESHARGVRESAIEARTRVPDSAIRERLERSNGFGRLTLFESTAALRKEIVDFRCARADTKRVESATANTPNATRTLETRRTLFIA